MFQHITTAIPLTRPIASLMARLSLLLLTCFWAAGLWAHPMDLKPNHALADSLVVASICEGNTYEFDGQLLDMSGEYVATFVAADGSDSTVTLQLSVLPPSFSEISRSICAGDTYDFEGEILDQAGTYTATVTAENGCDSIITLILGIRPTQQTNISATICEGDEYLFNGEAFVQSGAYSAVYEDENGCDSTVTLQLTVLPPVNTQLSAAICEGTEYPFQGDVLTESGVYSIVLETSTGCDSIVTLELLVAPFFETPVSASICPGSTYTFGGAELNTPGVYTELLTALGGCDSTIILTLELLPNLSSEIAIGICTGSTYDFYGEMLDASGTYEYVFPEAGSNGCDSIVVLTLDVVDFFDVTVDATICAGDVYLFDNVELTDEGVYTALLIAQGGCDSTVTLTLNVLPTATTALEATICNEDFFDYNGELLTDAGEYTFVFTGENGCDSTVVLTLNVRPAIQSEIAVTICDGDTYSFSGETLTLAGVYEAILEAENGCDSIVILTLTVLPTYQTALNVGICAGTTYDYHGEVLSDAGTYTFDLTADNGCDSTVTLTLTVFDLMDTTVMVNICAGDSYAFDGSLIADAGTYTATFVDANGCDSTVTLILGILPVQNSEISVRICDNETYAFNGEDLNIAGVYTGVFTGQNGCDSIVVLTLDVLPTQISLLDTTICDGDAFLYAGAALTVAGEYTYIFSTENGCDSTVTVRLKVLPVSMTTLEARICAGNSYDYNGELLSIAGLYPFTFTAANGCDSIVTVILEVLPIATSTLGVSLCEGSTYTFNGETFDVAGVYNFTFTGENGCDSIATLVLELVANFETNLQVSICDGATYVFGDDTLSVGGDYSQLLTAQGGCDSLVNLVLSILPHTQSSTEVNICAGESYNFNGLDLADSGTYTAQLTGENGCDSIATLILTVLPAITTALEVNICDNETYDFGGQVLSDAGVYTTLLTSQDGCDSTVVLTLSILPTQSSSISAAICANETFDFNGEILSAEGTYTSILTGENGCDSTITLELTVLPLAQGALAASVCNGETFAFNGQILTQSGQYEAVLPGAALNGCDSVATLFLTIFPAIPVTNLFAEICEGDAFDFFGTILTDSGDYSIDLASSLGCDSTIMLSLTVNPNVTTTLDALICAGDSYSFNGELLTQPGTYVAMLHTQSGCDSTVILTLLVNSVDVNVSVAGMTITAAATNATYQWIDCSSTQIIAGATNSTFTPAVTGNYAVVVTQNGCTATSTCVFVQIVSTHEPLGGAEWSIQPNPASTQTQILFSVPTDETLWLEIFDVAGRSLHRQMVTPGTQQIELSMQNMPDGILLVRLANDQQVSTKRLIKAQH